MRKDNSTLRHKVALRMRMLALIDTPVVLETHGGAGMIWSRCYSHLDRGVVFEKDAIKAGRLARQRPTWAVYEADTARALAAGAGAHLPVTVLDVDPYGDPWPTIAAFFTSTRPRAPRLSVVVNDGLRHKVRLGGAWTTGTLAPLVKQYGNDLHDVYLEVCQELMRTEAAKAGYALGRFGGYYCGHRGQMTHYLAVLEQG